MVLSLCRLFRMNETGGSALFIEKKIDAVAACHSEGLPFQDVYCMPIPFLDWDGISPSPSPPSRRDQPIPLHPGRMSTTRGRRRIKGLGRRARVSPGRRGGELASPRRQACAPFLPPYVGRTRLRRWTKAARGAARRRLCGAGCRDLRRPWRRSTAVWTRAG
jgi:hypothetical protein